MLSPFGSARHPFAALDVFQRPFFPYRTSYRWAQPTRPQSFRTTFVDRGEQFVFAVEVPGFAEKDLKIEVTREALTVSGARPTTTPEGYQAQVQERDEVKFSRTWSLPVAIDPDHVTAQVKDGLLSITLPKAAETRPRTIPLQAS